MLNSNFIASQNIRGSGRATVVLVQKNSDFCVLADKISESLSNLGQTYFLVLEDFGQDWKPALNLLQDFLDSSAIRNASFIAFENSSVLIQALVLKKPKLVRSLVFIDPRTREKSTAFSELIAKLENYLPLGLPFRSDFDGFDGKPFLQRIRCPMLLLLRTSSDPYLNEQIKVMNSSAPTSFFADISSFAADEVESKLDQTIRNFFDVPAKFPQKNLKYA
jgi:pimeloyl-ACP methyl ester carboxylesterase